MKKGELVEIIFLDHVENGEKPIEFVVYGKISHQDKISISIDCWHYADNNKFDSNVQRYIIVKSCIKKINKLKREKI